MLNQKEGEVAVFAVNRDEEGPREVEISLDGFGVSEAIQSISMTSPDRKMTNREDHSAVVPKENENAVLDGEDCRVLLSPLSFNMVRLKVRK